MTEVESCPNCHYALLEKSTYCPYCGFQLTHPPWKKMGAWVLLFLIGFALVKCHLRMLEGFP